MPRVLPVNEARSTPGTATACCASRPKSEDAKSRKIKVKG
jgi:hypothetical protein